MNLPLLTIVFPVCGAVTVGLVPRVFAGLRYILALAASALGLLATLLVVTWFSPDVATVQFAFSSDLAPALGVALSLGVDGISLGFLAVSALLCCASLAVRGSVGLSSNDQHGQPSTVPLLLAQAALAGVYCAQDAIVFWCFWTLFVFSSFLLVGSSGGTRRLLASSKLALSGLASLTVLLGVFLYLAAQVHAVAGRFSFEFAVLSRVLLPLDSQYTLLFLALSALVLALPLVPLSGWWNDTHSQSSQLGAVVLLLGPALYAFIRILLPCFPLAAFNFMPVVACAAALGAVCAAICCPFETDLRRKIAWAASAQTAIAVVGLTSLTPQGVMGALLVMAASTLALGSLFLCLRTDPSEPIANDANPSRFLTVLPTAFAASAALVPGLGGFAAAFTALAGLAAADRNHARAGWPEPRFDVEPLWLILCCVFAAIAVGAILLSALRTSSPRAPIERLGLRAWPLLVTLLGLVVLGLRPQVWSGYVEASIDQYVVQLQNRIAHASLSPQAPPHLFPTARSMMSYGAHKAPPTITNQSQSQQP